MQAIAAAVSILPEGKREYILGYLHCGMAAGMGKREVLLSAPGEVGDLWEL